MRGEGGDVVEVVSQEVEVLVVGESRELEGGWTLETGSESLPDLELLGLQPAVEGEVDGGEVGQAGHVLGLAGAGGGHQQRSRAPDQEPGVGESDAGDPLLLAPDQTRSDCAESLSSLAHRNTPLVLRDLQQDPVLGALQPHQARIGPVTDDKNCIQVLQREPQQASDGLIVEMCQGERKTEIFIHFLSTEHCLQTRKCSGHSRGLAF